MANVPNLSVVREPGKPKKLGRYEFEECLGAEGNRETHRARVKGLAGFDRIFALKCLRRVGSSPISRSDPFVVAAKRMTTVIDPRIARVLDADVIDGVAVAVTEFVHGLDLDRFREWAQVAGELATGSDGPARKWQSLIAYVGGEIAAALAALHAHAPPIVHGGLSPRNVIITSRGGVKLLDVGLGVGAQKGGESPSVRAAAYAAPAPPGADPTAASDVRALGAILFELAAGELPAPGVTSAAARRMLESIWPPMAELIGTMLAEDPSRRPRAAQVAEGLSKQWADVPEAAMASEMAALVRNFSAFVADGPATAGVAPTTPAPTPVDSPPSDVVAPAAPAASTGSFLSVSDAQTRVSPEGGGYANAIFKALPSEPPVAAPIAVPPVPAVRATLGPPIGRPTLRSFAPPKPSEMPAVRVAAVSPLAPRQAPLPVLAAGPLAKGAAALPTLPPPAPPAPVAEPPGGRPLAIRLASPVAPTIALEPEPAPFVQVPPVTGAAPLPTLEAVAYEEEQAAELEPMAETADWGAQALAALGTQAGISLSLLPTPTDGDGGFVAEAPPADDDAGMEEALAFAPHPAPPAENWMTAQPVSQGGPAFAPIEAPAPGAPARQELLEEELLDEEQTPLLALPGAGAASFDELPPPADIGYAPEPVVPDPGDAASVSRAPLEAMAFVAGDEPAEEPQPPLETVADETAASEDDELRQARTHLAHEDGLDEELASPPSRTKRIVLVLVAAAVLGAGAAALTLWLRGKPAPVAVVKPRVQKTSSSAATKPTAPAPRAAEGQVAKPTATTAPATKPATAKPQPAGVAVAEKPVAAVAEKPIAAPSPAGKLPAEPAPLPTAPVAKAKPASAPTELAATAPKPAERAAAKVAELAPSKAVAEVAAAAPSGSAGSVRLRVTSQPDGARVWIDGEERGQTPCVVSLRPGSARVVLVRAGHLTSQSTVEVREGAAIDEKLKPVEPPMSGEARFRAECQTQGKLPIVVDGKETGILCPFSKMRVDPGTHTIGLFIPATGKIHQKEVTLSPGVRSVVFGD